MNKIKNWIKQPQVWGFFASVAVLAVISVAFFYPDNFEGNSLMQADMQQGAANGHEAQEYAAATGEKALWTNALMSGMPTFQISPSYPSNSLFTWINAVYGLWLPEPSNLLFMMMFGFLIMLFCMRMRWPVALLGAVAWGLSTYFVIIIGAGHLWKFITLSYIPPTIGGLVLCYRRRWVLGGALAALFAMLQLNANHPQMTYYFAFVMVGFVIAFLVDAVRRHAVGDWLKGSAILLLAGCLAVGANLPNLYNTYEYSKETKRAQSELTEPASADSGAPAERPTGGLSKWEIVNWSYGRQEMVSLLIPNIKGGATVRPEKGQMSPMTLDRLDRARSSSREVQAFLPYFYQYFNDSEGTNGPVYVGAVIFALFLLGCVIVRGPLKWALLALTVLSILLALGRNLEWLTDLMIYHFPMYSKFRAVESILVVAEFTMPLLAVLGLAQYFNADDKAQRLRQREAMFIVFGICALICLAGWLAPSKFGSAFTSHDFETLSAIGENYSDYVNPNTLMETVRHLRYGMLSADAGRSLLLLAIGAALLWAYSAGKVSRFVATAALFAVVLLDLYNVDKRYVSSDSFAANSAIGSGHLDPLAPDAIDNLISADTTMHYRVMDVPGFGSATRSYHHHMIGGYHAAKLNRYEDLIQRRMQYSTNLPRLAAALGAGSVNDVIDLTALPDSALADSPAQLRELAKELSADMRVLDMLNARYIITGDKEQPVMLNSDALGNAWLVSDIKYVDNADSEMSALSTLHPGSSAVADKKFRDILGEIDAMPAASDTIYLTSYTPNRLAYRARTANGGLAVFSEIYFPWGWHATIDGNEAQLGRVDYVLRAMRVPAGDHELAMTFDPQSLHVTGGIAYACVTMIYLWLCIGIFAAVMRWRYTGSYVEK